MGLFDPCRPLKAVLDEGTHRYIVIKDEFGKLIAIKTEDVITHHATIRKIGMHEVPLEINSESNYRIPAFKQQLEKEAYNYKNRFEKVLTNEYYITGQPNIYHPLTTITISEKIARIIGNVNLHTAEYDGEAIRTPRVFSMMSDLKDDCDIFKPLISRVLKYVLTHVLDARKIFIEKYCADVNERNEKIKREKLEPEHRHYIAFGDINKFVYTFQLAGKIQTIHIWEQDDYDRECGITMFSTTGTRSPWLSIIREFHPEIVIAFGSDENEQAFTKYLQQHMTVYELIHLSSWDFSCDIHKILIDALNTLQNIPTIPEILPRRRI